MKNRLHGLRLLLGLAIVATLIFTIPRSALQQHQHDEQSLMATSFKSPTVLSSPLSVNDNLNTSHFNGTMNPINTTKTLDICFITCVYAKWASHADKLQNVSIRYNTPENSDFHFFAYTNLPGLQPHRNGWTKIVKTHPQYQRYITQSRWPKFLAWQEDPLALTQNRTTLNSVTTSNTGCDVIFYLDSIGHLIGSPDEFRQMAYDIYNSEVGLAQYPHKGGGGAFGEFRRIEVFKKDLPENIQASKQWLLQQPDFRPYNCTLFENRYFGYRPSSPQFKKASKFLWQHYSKEQDSWRDQPLWCYVLDKYNITPMPLRHQRLFKIMTWRMGKSKHRYGEKDTEANATVNIKTK